jgi:spermidine synthase
MTHGRDIYRLYFVDLCASGIGAFCFTFLLRPLGADILMWFVSGVALCGFIVYALTVDLSRVYILSLPSLFLLGCIFWGNNLINDHPVYYKKAAQLREWGATLEHSEWTTIAKIDVWSFDETGSKQITMDGDCLTRMPSPLYPKSYFISKEDASDYWVRCQRIPYFIRSSPDDVLVIGSGGGLEIVMANAWSAEHITSVEINPAIYDLVRGPYRDFLKWPKWEHVTLHNAEGRHFVRNTEAQYDVISMTGVDTYTALSSGAYVLAENYLYTVEAIEDYLNALKQDGVMLILRWFYSKQPRESLRLVNLFVYAAERFGIENPSQCIMVIALCQSVERSWAATLFKREPFTQEEVETLLSRLKGQKDLTPIYIPDVFQHDTQNKIEAEVYSQNLEEMDTAIIAYNRLIRSETVEARKAFEEEYPFKIDPVFDNRPFFYEFFKADDLFKFDRVKHVFRKAELAHYLLYILFALTFLISFLAMILPLQLFEREGLKVQRLWSLLMFFCSLGIGFMFIELGLMQKLSIYLGHPMHTLSVVLAGILIFTGIGSYRTGTKSIDRIRLLREGMIGTAVASLIWLIVMVVLIPFTLGWSIWIRIPLALLSMLPVGLFMGMPFATGLRYLEEYYPRFIPWAWGINGLTSVMGSVLAIIFAMRVGFTVVILLGCVSYVLGFLAVLHHLRSGWRVT